MTDLLVDVLVASSLRAALLASLVAGMLAAWRLRAVAVRHTAWTIVLIAMLLMPVLPAVVPSIDVPVLATARHFAPAPPGLPRVWQTSPTVSEPAAAPPAARADRVPIPAVSAGWTSDVTTMRGWSWSRLALGVYLAGALLMLLRLVVGLRGAVRLTRQSERISPPTDHRPFLWAPVDARVHESRHVAVPATVGLFRPTVVLPLGWRRWSDTQLEAVLAHELAHVARRDSLVAGLAALNLCLFWFHPLAWWLRRTLALTAEQACDDVAVQATGLPSAYIDLLTCMAATVREGGGRLRWQGVGMSGSPLLARRIDHVRSAPGRPTLPRVVTTVVAAGCCLASLAVAACRPADDLSEDRRREVEWLIDRHPDTEVAVAQADRPVAEEILLRRWAEDPAGPWSARLGRFYASSMFGYMVRVTDRGPLREMTDHDPESAFATEARARLDESNDPEMLAAAAKFLRRALHYGGSFTERDVLARGYLERAVGLDPENVDTRAMLVSVALREREHTVWQGTLTVAPVDQYEALTALPEAERFDRLPHAAKAAQRKARRGSLHNDRNMDRYVSVQADNARRFALDTLALTPGFGSHPDVGTAIYTANMTLASLAVLDGDIDTATEYLGRASMAPPAEGLAYGRRVAAWVVVRQLVGAGERAAVVRFLEAMADKSIVEHDLMRATADDVRVGQPPARLFEARAAYP